MKSKYRIGTAVRCFGLKGDIVIQPETFDVNRYFDLAAVFVGKTEETARELTIEMVRIHKGRPILKFQSVDSRNDAERLIGHVLYVNEEDRIELPEGMFFIHELIGMKVYTVDDTFVGTIRDVLQLPAHNTYIVQSEHKEVLIPAVDEFVESIDIEERVIRIKPIEGLLE